MIYPKNIEEKLGFDKIRQLLKEECISTLGQNHVDEIQFSDDYERIERLTSQTNEFCDILQQSEQFPQQNYIDVSRHLVKAMPQDAFLDEAEFFDLKLSLNTIYQCLLFFENRPPQAYPCLRELSQNVTFNPDLISKIELVVNERGKMRDDASFQLRSIRGRIISEQTLLRKRLDQILRESKRLGYVKEDAELTVRDGRLVIPIAAEHKRKIRGVVHDESATGLTVFMEPAEIIDLNNTIRELIYEERREMMRILIRLT
ncbi:MAG: endonuclease MutS2, partial [Bacteroidia bacterium]|nr:endonuclease MutS2 [Bacteroidia bacterium]